MKINNCKLKGTTIILDKVIQEKEIANRPEYDTKTKWSLYSGK